MDRNSLGMVKPRRRPELRRTVTGDVQLAPSCRMAPERVKPDESGPDPRRPLHERTAAWGDVRAAAGGGGSWRWVGRWSDGPWWAQPVACLARHDQPPRLESSRRRGPVVPRNAAESPPRRAERGTSALLIMVVVER
jgi:hypothetical protein